jgi:hypothetical protein
MKKSTLIFIIVFSLSGISGYCYGQSKNTEKEKKPNQLTKKEVKEGWMLLWDGSKSMGWRSINSKSFPESGWEMKDGILTILSSQEQPKRGGDIVTEKTFKSFELVVDFMYTKGANSGIKYFIGPESAKGTISNVGCEYQVLDDANHPDAKAGFEGNRTLAGLYDLIAPKNKKDNGYDKWNRAKIIVKGNHVEHWLNGQKTVEYERKSPQWYELVAKSKFKNTKEFAGVEESHILLQDHGNRVSFRNIKIREIN